MKTIKIIDLLNKIANEEDVPKKIRYEGRDMFWCKPCKIYEVAEVKQNELCGTDLYNILDNLNDEVEILEEDKKIKKIIINDDGMVIFPDGQWTTEKIDRSFAIIINEIIDYINKEEK